MPRTYTRSCNCLRCPKCRDRERFRLRHNMKRRGTWVGYVDPEIVVRHVKRLLDAGMTRADIARASDTSWKAVSAYSVGKPTRTSPEVAEAILGVQPKVKQRRFHNFRPATGSRRRLQALAAMGWSIPHLVELSGLGEKGLYDIRSGISGQVHPDRAQAIERIYDELAMRPGPSAITRNYANRVGWLPPLAWDDDELDNPDAKPHMPKGEHRGNPGADLPPIEQIVAEVNRGSVKAVAAHYRVHKRTLERRLAAAGYRARQVGAYTYVYVREDAA